MKYLLTFVIALVLTGCSMNQTGQALSVISSATDIKYHYDNGKAVEFIDNAELTDEEVTIVLEAMEQVDKSKVSLKRYEDNPELIVLNLNEIIYEYSKIRSSYLSVRNVVLANQSEYNSGEWQVFIEFDAAARTLDQQFKDLVNAAEANASLMTALALANTTLKIASML